MTLEAALIEGAMQGGSSLFVIWMVFKWIAPRLDRNHAYMVAIWSRTKKKNDDDLPELV